MLFAATWMDLEIIILSGISERQISYDITYMWNLKKIYKFMITSGEGNDKLGV